MPQSLQEYADWLDNRGLIWPKLPEPKPPKATPHLKPLEGIRAVTWSIYGTLLRIADGELLHRHPQEFRMQVALEKTIEEFQMWHSMSRKPGAPWEYMLRQYVGVLEQQQMRGTKRKGDFPQISSDAIWRKLIGRLVKNDYSWDEEMYGDLEEFSVKVAYFFHMRLQGIGPARNAVEALNAVSRAGLVQGLLANSQPFTLTQMLRAFREHATLSNAECEIRSAEFGIPHSTLRIPHWFDSGPLTLSHRLGVSKPSKSLYQNALRQLKQLGISPDEVLHVGSRLPDDLAAAKQYGMRTALYVGDAPSVQAQKEDLRDPDVKPDRLLRNLSQIGQILETR